MALWQLLYFCCASLALWYTATRCKGTGCDKCLIRALFNIAELKTCIGMAEILLVHMHSIGVCS